MMQTPRLEGIDYHVHTSRSVCCQQSQTLAVLAKAYSEAGITHVALCDHYYPGRLDPFREARVEADALSKEYGMDIRLSAEIEIEADGGLDCPELRDLMGILDHTSGAPHTKSLIKTVPAGSDPVSHIHRAHMNALANPGIDVLLHPWDGAEAVVNGLDEVPEGWLREFAEAAAASGRIVEVSNCMNHYWIRPTAFTESYDLLVEELVRAGVPLVVGSDGHNMSLVPEAWHLSVATTTGDTSWAVAAVRRAGGSDSSIRLPLRRNG